MAVRVARKAVTSMIRHVVRSRRVKTRQVWIPGGGLVRVERLAVWRAPWWFFGNLIGQVEQWVLPDGRQVRAQRQGPEEWALCWWHEPAALMAVIPQGDPAGVSYRKTLGRSAEALPGQTS